MAAHLAVEQLFSRSRNRFSLPSYPQLLPGDILQLFGPSDQFIALAQ